MNAITTSGHETDKPSPTGQDLYKLAVELQRAYARRIGYANKVCLRAFIDTGVDEAQFAADLGRIGYELYTDATNNLVIRTKAAGDAERALVQAEKDLDYLERNRDMGPYAHLPSLR